MSRRFQADSFRARMISDVITIAMKFQIVCARQMGDELLVGIGLRPAQLVVEMDDRKDNPKLVPQLQQQP